MNVQHSSRTDRWYTPTWVLEKARRVLGIIDLDPASEAAANTRVQALTYFRAEDDGLSLDWFGTVWCNPPGGKIGNKSLTGLFWRRLMLTRDQRRLRHAMFMCFSAEALQSTQEKGTPAVGDFPFCVPSKRIRFDRPDYSAGEAPSHSNVIVYVPGTVDHTKNFWAEFNTVGSVMVPYR